MATVGACTGELSALDPAGPAAARIADLWWVMLAGAMLILGGVMAAALYSLRRERRGYGLSAARVLVGWGLVFPVVTLAALMGHAFWRGEQLLARPGSDHLTVAVHAEQWAWTFGYPGGESTTDALHVPAGEPFEVRITSGDVIHSLWIPRLGGKMDAIPGKETRVVLRADAPGLYRGACAEYCGAGHAHMNFVVRAHPPEAYAAALAEAADLRPGDELPVLERRRRPALDAIESGLDDVLRWIGLR